MISILPKLKRQAQKAFIFIDPYEYKHIKANQIKSLMETGNAEVLLWLPTQQMYRFASNGTPQALKDFIEDLVQIEDWKSKNAWDFCSPALKTVFRIVWVTVILLIRLQFKKIKNTLYCLFFFSSHIKGFEKMLESKWQIDTEQGQGWDYAGNQPSLFHQQKTNPLEQKLKEFLKGGRRYNGETYEFTLRQGFLPKHCNEVFYNWQNSGLLKVALTSEGKVRKGAFYIAYKYYKDKEDNKKVTFELNKLMAQSTIEWTEMTWNPTTGCDKVSQGCKHCYAEIMSKRLHAMGVEKYKDAFKVQEHESALADPYKWKKPKIIFVNSMSDLFHKDVSVEFIQKVFDVMNETDHVYQLLTKRPERLLALDNDNLLRWSHNIWMGVSVEDDQVLSRIDFLRDTKARVKFLSL